MDLSHPTDIPALFTLLNRPAGMERSCRSQDRKKRFSTHVDYFRSFEWSDPARASRKSTNGMLIINAVLLEQLVVAVSFWFSCKPI